MNINCLAVTREYYINPFQERYQVSKGFPFQVYEIWQDNGGTKWRKVKRMTGIQEFSYPEFLVKFVEENMVDGVMKMDLRRISNAELADLPSRWENATVDTTKYYQNVIYAYEVSKSVYEKHKRIGGLCQEYKDKFYIA